MKHILVFTLLTANQVWIRMVNLYINVTKKLISLTTLAFVVIPNVKNYKPLLGSRLCHLSPAR